MSITDAEAVRAIARCNTIAALHALTVAWRAQRATISTEAQRAMDQRQAELVAGVRA